MVDNHGKELKAKLDEANRDRDACIKDMINHMPPAYSTLVKRLKTESPEAPVGVAPEHRPPSGGDQQAYGSPQALGRQRGHVATTSAQDSGAVALPSHVQCRPAGDGIQRAESGFVSSSN